MSSESYPKRIQMSRQRPWRAENPDAVIVARPSKWGNPFAAKIKRGEAGQATATREYLVEDFRRWLLTPLVRRMTREGWADVAHNGQTAYLGVPFADRARILDSLEELRGRDLACWCPTSQPCHADVLLEIANGAPDD